jgi:PAS domain S-box-containing protein
MRALVADDNEQNLYYLRALLEGNGFQVATVRDGAAALAAAREAPPDIAISDLLMPVMDGYTLLRQWRADPRLGRVPFIVYTATYTSAADEKLAFDLGADDFIIKPAEPELLLPRILKPLAAPAAPRMPAAADEGLLQQYSDVLRSKLEHKMAQLEAANEALRGEVAERRRMQDQQKAILDALPAEVALLDAGGDIVEVNESWQRAGTPGPLPRQGIQPTGTNYLRVCDEAPGADARAAAEGIRRVLRGEIPQYGLEYACPSPEAERWFRMAATPIAAGTAGGAVVMHLDVTERVRREALLRQQSELLDKAKDAISVRDLDGRIGYWNRAAESIYGWSREEATGRPVEDLLFAGDPDRFRGAWSALIRDGGWSGRLPAASRRGRPLTIEASWTLVTDAAGKPAACLAIETDITERLLLESRLAQSQKLQAIGELTGGVAHDFNNLLAVVSGNLELVEEALATRPDLQRMLRTAIRATERGTTLTGSLLAFSRRQALEPRAVDANEMIREMAELVRRTVPQNIEVAIRPDCGWQCEADPGQLQNALLNLVVNARDAMPRGGRLTIETRDVLVGADDPADPELAPGAYVALAVSDTGSGIAPDVLGHVFEPFFTTKEIGKGTGLGLSMVYGFAKQSLGHVRIYTELGQGTTVRIYLPRSGGAGGLPAADEMLPTAGPGGETILVVEDDVDLRSLTSGLLRSLGYAVLAVDRAQEALRVLGEMPQIALLLTDIVLPGGIDGRELADAARRRRPDLGIVFMSGTPENALQHQGRLAPGLDLIEKPFRRRDLAAKIRSVLDRSASR